jgi:hypothetical protein
MVGGWGRRLGDEETDILIIIVVVGGKRWKKTDYSRGRSIISHAAANRDSQIMLNDKWQGTGVSSAPLLQAARVVRVVPR